MKEVIKRPNEKYVECTLSVYSGPLGGLSENFDIFKCEFLWVFWKLQCISGYLFSKWSHGAKKVDENNKFSGFYSSLKLRIHEEFDSSKFPAK